MTINVTVIGNASRDPELRFTPNGSPVANFGLAVNKRRKDGDKWVDDGTDWYNVTAWRDLAHNVADSVEKGMRVVVTGRLTQRTYETKDGESRTSVEITADDIGPSLKWATVKVNRNERSDKSNAGASNGWSGGGKAAPAPTYDPSEEPF